jgi:hypothetical protein
MCSSVALLKLCYICMYTTESFALLRAHISSMIPCNQLRTSLLVASTKDLSVFSLIHLGSCFVHDRWVTVCCFNCHLASVYSDCSPFVSLLLTSDNLDGCFPVILQKGLRTRRLMHNAISQIPCSPNHHYDFASRFFSDR